MMVTKEEKKPNQTEVHIIDEYRTSIVEHGDGKQYSKRDCTHTDHYIRGFTIGDGYPSIKVPFKVIENKPYYLLYALYQTGDSFGYDTGNIEFIDMYRKSEHAMRNRDLIEEHYKKYKGSHDYDNMFSLTLYRSKAKPYTIHVPWNGYFERLEYTEMTTIFLKREGLDWI